MAREPVLEALLAAYAAYREHLKFADMNVPEERDRVERLWRRYWEMLTARYEERRGLVRRFESLQALHRAVKERYENSYKRQMRPPPSSV